MKENIPPCWMFGLRHLRPTAQKPRGCGVGPGLGEKMALSWKACANKYHSPPPVSRNCCLQGFVSSGRHGHSYLHWSPFKTSKQV